MCTECALRHRHYTALCPGLPSASRRDRRTGQGAWQPLSRQRTGEEQRLGGGNQCGGSRVPGKGLVPLGWGAGGGSGRSGKTGFHWPREPRIPAFPAARSLCVTSSTPPTTAADVTPAEGSGGWAPLKDHAAGSRPPRSGAGAGAQQGGSAGSAGPDANARGPVASWGWGRPGQNGGWRTRRAALHRGPLGAARRPGTGPRRTTDKRGCRRP